MWCEVFFFFFPSTALFCLKWMNWFELSLELDLEYIELSEETIQSRILSWFIFFCVLFNW